MVGEVMAKFVKDIVASGKSATSDETKATMKPFIDAMIQEGSYIMKPACYTGDMVNPTVPTCLKGSPWVEKMVIPYLIGDLQNSLIEIINDDNFHKAATVYPYHHPEFDGTCDVNTTVPCTLNHKSVTENVYSHLNEFDTGKESISAYEMRVKLKSSQFMHQRAGEVDADFDALDMTLQECKRVNQASWDWAYNLASDAAKANYDTYGEKVVMVDDRIDTNGGTWIYKPL